MKTDQNQQIDGVDLSTLDVDDLDAVDAVDATVLDDIDSTDDVADLIRSSGRAVAPVDDGTIGGPRPVVSHWSSGPGRWADRFVGTSKVPASIWAKMNRAERRKVERERRADLGIPEPVRVAIVRRCHTCDRCLDLDAVDRRMASPLPKLRRDMRLSRSRFNGPSFGSTVSTGTPSTMSDNWVDICTAPKTSTVDIDREPDAVRGLPGRGDIAGPVVRVNATPTVYVDERGRRASARTFRGRRTGRTHPVLTYRVDVEHLDQIDIEHLDQIDAVDLLDIDARNGSTGKPLEPSTALDLLNRGRSSRIAIDARRDHVENSHRWYETRLDRFPRSAYRYQTINLHLDLDGVDAVDLVAAVVAGPGRSTSVAGHLVAAHADTLDAVERVRFGDTLDVAGRIADAVRRSFGPDRSVGPNYVPVSRADSVRFRFQPGRFTSGDLVYGVEMIDGVPVDVVIGRRVPIGPDVPDGVPTMSSEPETVRGTRFVLSRSGWYVAAK